MPEAKHRSATYAAALAVILVGATLAGAVTTLSFKPPKLPPGNAGVPYPPFKLCSPAPPSSGDLCPPSIFSAPKNPKGGNPPYHFVMDSGSFLPLGMTLDLNGTIRGTPDVTDNGTFTFSICAVDLSASSVCVPMTLKIFNLDGNYTGTFKGVANLIDGSGKPFKQSVSGGVAASIDTGVITVTAPGDGTGAVSPLGAADFGSTGGVGLFGADCSFAGSFVTSKNGAVKAAGTFSCTVNVPGVVTGDATGTWTAKRL